MRTSGLDVKLTADGLALAEWTCSGAVLRWGVERPEETEVILQREGIHRVRLGRDERTVDIAAFSVARSGDEYLRCSPSSLRQRSTHILLSGEFAEAFRAITPRTAAVSARAAILHGAALRAPGPLAQHEAVVALVSEILALARAPAPAPPERHSWHVLADDTQQVLARRHTERLTLDVLAAACGASPFHLARVFRAVTGTSIHRYQTRLRLRAAVHAIADGERDLSRLAVSLGFSSHSHFTSAFRSEYGMVPSRVRVRAGF